MIALFFLFLTLSVSPFKSKSRLEAENAALRHQLIVAAAQGARSRPAHKWGSLVLGHAVSMVSIDPQGHHDHPARDRRALVYVASRLPRRSDRFRRVSLSPAGRSCRSSCAVAGV